MKILAIWITKGLFIFVVCIAEWNVCSNLEQNYVVTKIISGGSFDAITKTGMYYCNGVENVWCFLIVINGDIEIKQIRFGNDTAIIAQRLLRRGVWSEWH